MRNVSYQVEIEECSSDGDSLYKKSGRLDGLATEFDVKLNGIYGGGEVEGLRVTKLIVQMWCAISHSTI